MAKTLDKPSLYDTDYVAWLEEQVAHLRAGRLAALDVRERRGGARKPDEEASAASSRTDSRS